MQILSDYVLLDSNECLWEIYAIMSQKTLTKRMCRTGAYIKTKWEFRIRYDANEQEGSGIDQLRTIQLSVYPTQIDCIRKTRDKLKITDLWFNCESEYHNIILHDKFKYYRVKNTLDDYWYKVDCVNYSRLKS